MYKRQALAPNDALVTPGFLRRVLRFSLPAGLVAGATTFGLYEHVRGLDTVALPEARTAATITLLLIGLTILVLISRPLKPWKIALAAAMAGMYAITITIPFGRRYFELDPPGGDTWGAVIVASLLGSFLVIGVTRLLDREHAPRA